MSPSEKRKPFFDIFDWLMLAGIVCLTAGVGWICRPAAPILLGVLLMAISYIMSSQKGQN